MGKVFTVKTRKKCKTCGAKITEPRYRTFCCKKCRTKDINKRNYKRQVEWARNKRGEKEKDKLKCLICGKWYYQLGSHVVQQHKLTARDYRIEFGFDYKTGKETTATRLRKLYKKQALENGTYKNLKAGVKYHFTKGDKRAGRYERSEQTIARLKKQFKKT